MTPSVDALVQRFQSVAMSHARYVARDLAHPSLTSFTWWALALTALVFTLERLRPSAGAVPTRRERRVDAVHSAMNLVGYGVLGFVALSDVVGTVADGWLDAALPGLRGGLSLRALPAPAQVAVAFVARDLVHYGVHRLMHASDVLYRFHEVHHASEGMTVLSHLRFHPVETVVYRVLEYLPLALLGLSVRSLLAAHVTSLAIGHFAHARTDVPLGPLARLVVTGRFHRLHHAARPGRVVNFGLSLAVWDRLFGTDEAPDPDAFETRLGLPDGAGVPAGFLGQLVEPFRTRGSRDG